MTLLAEVVATSQAVAASSARSAKIRLLAERLAQCPPEELEVVVAWLSGRTRQRRTGLGWASLRELPPPAAHPTLDVTSVDRALEESAGLVGSGAATARKALLSGILTAATAEEQRFIAALIAGELRQGAAAGVLVEAVAAAATVPVARVRRALTVRGDLAEVAVTARRGGVAALDALGLEVGRPLTPMLASSAPDLGTALTRTGPAAVEWKLDGVRVQVHRDGRDVAVFTRTLDEITGRVPEVVQAARSLPVDRAVLDGEVIALQPGGRPRPFQVTSARAARRDPRGPDTVPLTSFFFDVLHVEGEDQLERADADRRRVLERIAPPQLLVPRHTVTDPGDPAGLGAAAAFAADAVARGHEGILVKAATAGYSMGRRVAEWVKVKPRVTMDLVVLAVEWGHGRRTGLLSNLHLGARDPEGRFGAPGGFVMLGKTFKGLTDVMLRWQTERLLALEERRERGGILVRPELVVEIAFDGVQTSPRYPAGVALRFARVLAHRPDKPASEADTVEAVLRLLPLDEPPALAARVGDGEGDTDG